MTDAKDVIVTPEWIAVVRHNWGLDTMSPHEAATKWADAGLPFSGIVTALGLALNHITTLTRERDEAVKRRREIDDEAFDYAEQIETLRTQLAAARELMAEAATDIGYMVNAEYHGPDDVHPAMRAKYARDIEIVTRLTAALAQEGA